MSNTSGELSPQLPYALIFHAYVGMPRWLLVYAQLALIGIGCATLHSTHSPAQCEIIAASYPMTSCVITSIVQEFPLFQ